MNANVNAANRTNSLRQFGRFFLSPEILANAFGHCKIMNYLTNERATEMEQKGIVKMMKEEKLRRFYIITQTKRAKKDALTMNTPIFKSFHFSRKKKFNLMSNCNRKTEQKTIHF